MLLSKQQPPQRARVFVDQQLCFSCFGASQLIRSFPRPRKCEKDGSNSSHNPLLYGAERVFSVETSKTSPITTNASCSVSSSSEQHTQPMQNNAESTNFASVTDVKGLLLQVFQVRLESDERAEYALVLCD